MGKANYNAWELKIDDFYKIRNEEDRIKFLINFAIVAPSSHNSQPWLFSANTSEISVFLNESRKLKISDRFNRQAYISIGCAIRNILIAADFYGYDCVVDLHQDSNLVAKIRITKKNNINHEKDNSLVLSIFKRVTNRGKFVTNRDLDEFLKKIQTEENGQLKVYVIVGGEQKKKLIDVALESSIIATSDKSFRLELSEFILNNFTNRRIGMPGFGLEMPWPISLIAPFIVKYLNVNKLNLIKNRDLLENYTPAFVIIAAPKDTQEYWLKVGELYEEITLRSVAIGLSTAMWAAPIETDNYHKDLKKILNIENRPLALFRIGYPLGFIKHSPRIRTCEVFKK